MSKFSENHPVLAEAGDTVLSVFSDSFALLVTAAGWLREQLGQTGV